MNPLVQLLKWNDEQNWRELSGERLFLTWEQSFPVSYAEEGEYYRLWSGTLQ